MPAVKVCCRIDEFFRQRVVRARVLRDIERLGNGAVCNAEARKGDPGFHQVDAFAIRHALSRLFSAALITQRECAQKYHVEQYVQRAPGTGDHLGGPGSSGGAGIIDHVIRRDQILLSLIEHPVDIRFIVLIAGERDFRCIIRVGAYLPEPIFFPVFSVFVFPDQPHQRLHADLVSAPARLFHPVERPGSPVYICLHDVSAHYFLPFITFLQLPAVSEPPV